MQEIGKAELDRWIKVQKEAYQRQGILRYLEGTKGYSLALEIAEDYSRSITQIAYEYDIPWEAVDKYWLLALSRS